jgi:hypothetical protein
MQSLMHPRRTRVHENTLRISDPGIGVGTGVAIDIEIGFDPDSDADPDGSNRSVTPTTEGAKDMGGDPRESGAGLVRWLPSPPVFE